MRAPFLPDPLFRPQREPNGRGACLCYLRPIVSFASDSIANVQAKLPGEMYERKSA
jgi:hypothetical protein